jgi:hypothetical protein
MAHRFGIYRDHISEIENGKKNVCLPLEVLARGFKMTLAELMKGVYVRIERWRIFDGDYASDRTRPRYRNFIWRRGRDSEPPDLKRLISSNNPVNYATS